MGIGNASRGPVRGVAGNGLAVSQRQPWAWLTPGHSSDRRRTEPGKITRKGGRRPSRVTRSALARDLARLHTGAPGGWPAPASPRLALIAAPLNRCGGPPPPPAPPPPLVPPGS